MYACTSIIWRFTLFLCLIHSFLFQALYLDVSKGGLNFSNLTIGQFPVYAALIMLVVDFVLYGLLAVYLDNVIPGQFQSLSLLFMFLLEHAEVTTVKCGLLAFSVREIWRSAPTTLLPDAIILGTT